MSFKLAEKLGKAFFGRRFRAAQIMEFFRPGSFWIYVGNASQINYRAMPREAREKLELLHAFKGGKTKLYVSADGKAALLTGGFRFTGRGFTP
jgi:hypothetical protein